MILMAFGLITAVIFYINLSLLVTTPYLVMNLLGVITSLLIMLVGAIDESDFFFPKKIAKETTRQVKKTTV